MKTINFICIGIGIFGIIFVTWILWNHYISSMGNFPPQDMLNGNGETAKPTINDDQLKYSERTEESKTDIDTVMMKSTFEPRGIKLRESELNSVSSVTVLQNALLKDGSVLWSGNQEEITSVQQSPDGSMVLFFNCNTNEYEIYHLDGEKLHRMDIRLPNQDQATRVDRWYWMGNENLIGEHLELFDPAPQGYQDEGWTKGIILYSFDLNSKRHYRVRLHEPRNFKSDQHKFIRSTLDPYYFYDIPIVRYCSIKGIFDDGTICVISLDTSSPRGANVRDEGYFEITKDQ